ncbi:MAG: respiratory nitrate reductase subunit gamma [Candidatus Thermoplasmatota archaeon]|nr:respiratory nitrate reductase subunit gamma [Candidatus Thermoplasmatota archaeon]
MPEGRYLKDKAWLYFPFFAVVILVSAVILLLPYETVYVRERVYLEMFLVTVVVCVAVFFIGTLYNVLLWAHGKGLSGSPERRVLGWLGRCIRLVFSRRFAKLVVVFLRDAMYLSKLKDRSVTRWLMHLLILGGFAVMFVLDLVVTFSLDFLKYEPMISEDGWAKLWLRDFGFDLVGAMMLAGLLIAAVRRFIQRPKMVRTELPDAASILFLLAVVLGGFILEGMGIAGGIPDHGRNVEYSFLGYAFSLAMPASAGEWYDHAWLVHAIMSALLIAYIPFSKLFHMIATPIAIEVDRLMSKEVRTA